MKGSGASLALSMNVNELEQVRRAYLENRRRHRGNREEDPSIAGLSDAQTYCDDQGTVYEYTLLTHGEVRGIPAGIRIDRCYPATPSLRVPAEIKETPVRSVGAGAFQQLESVRRLELPDTIERIGSNAFVGCVNLEYLKLPATTPVVDPFWFRDCSNLMELILPDSVETLRLGLLESCPLRRLSIGSQTQSFAYGFFKNSVLETLTISPDNPYLATDGHGIYNKDFTRLIAQAVRTPIMELPQTCTVVGRKAFTFDPVLREVVLPETLQVIEGYAFAHTAVNKFHAPRDLRVLGTKAFFRCEFLTEATLNEGLEELGDEVFAQTSLERLVIPASVRSLGKRLVHHTAVIPSGINATFAIDKDNASYHLSPDGALYTSQDGTLVLIEHVDPGVTHCQVEPGTNAIGYRAFIRHPSMESVTLSEGVRSIGEAAFRGCTHLKSITIPTSLERIGAEAFIDTSLESLYIPKGLTSIGRIALITRGGNRAVTPPTLQTITVDPANTQFYMKSGFLCEHKSDGFSRLLVYAGPEEHVVIPSEVNDIEEYALTGVVGLKSLRIHDHVRYLGTSCLAVGSPIPHVYLELPKPIDGRTEVDLKLPPTYAGQRVLILGTTDGRIDVPLLCHLCDNAILSIDEYGLKAEFALDRLLDPLLLDPLFDERFRRMLRRNLIPICLDFAHRNRYRGIDKLVDAGILTHDRLTAVIDAVSDADEVEMTGFLLEVKRERFGDASLDFEL